MRRMIHGAWSAALLAIVISGPLRQAAGEEKTDAAGRQYNAAVTLQNRGLFDMAAAEWTKFLGDYPADPRRDRALHYLGVCHLKTGQLDAARQCFETVVKTYPKCELLDATYYCLGTTLYSLGQAGKAEMYDAAAAAFQTVATKYPESKYAAQSLYNRGECLYRRGKRAEAAAMYAQLLAKFPGDRLAADALYGLGVSQEELKQQAEAGKSYDLFLEKYPQNPLAAEVTLRRGETLFALGQFERAAERFAAAAAKPEFALADHATVRQAAAMAELKKYVEAAALYDSIASRWPQSKLVAAAALSGGKCFYMAGDYAAARKLLGQALAAGGQGGGEAAHWLVRSLLKEGKPVEAAAEAEKLLPKLGDGPQAAQVMMDQAEAVYEIPARRGDAVALYAALAARYPQDPLAPQALYMAAFTALGKADYTSAGKHAATFLAAYPQHELAAEVSYIAAESQLQLGQNAEAEKLLARMVEKYPRHAEAESWRVRRGLAIELQKRPDEAVKVLQAALKEIKSPEVRAEAYYLIGGSQIELKQFDAAVKSLAAALAAAPKWRQADETLLAMANAYSQAGHLDKAKETVGKLIAEFPESKVLDRATYRLAEYAFAGGDWQAAAAGYQQVLDKWPQSALVPYALYGLGWAKLNAGDYAGAEKAIDALVARYGGHKLTARGRYARGMARQQLGKYAAAMDDLRVFLAAEALPAEKAAARYVLGLCQAGLKQHAEAAATFQGLAAENPKSAIADKVLYELAWSLKQQGKEKEAAATFARLAEQWPDSPLAAEARYHAGEFAYKSGQFKQAAVAYYGSLAKAGTTELGEKAAHKLGWSYFRGDDFANAQQTFAYQRTTWPTGPLAADAAFMEGECLFKQKKFEAAMAAYGGVKQTASKDFQALALLHAGQAAAQLKQWDKGLELLAKCVEQFPAAACLPEALYEEGWAQQNLGKLAEAVALYQQVIAKTDREVAARAQFMIGEVQFQQKNHKEAVASFFKVSYGYAYPQWQAEASYEAARCFEALEQREQAIKQYQELMEKFPASDKAAIAKDRIKALRQ